MSSSFSLYVHIPFCSHRCAYCDFNTYAGLEELIPDYVQALVTEIEALAHSADSSLPVKTVFFGGGTPSLLSVSHIERVLQSIVQNYVVEDEAEISLEANPGKLKLDYLSDLRGSGVNRLSLGVQSSSNSDLRLLERQHDFLDVLQSVNWARQAGFDNLNIDLIFALPGQSLASWQRSLERTLELEPEHLSLYALSIEHGTPFKNLLKRGLLPIPDPDLAADMYEWAQKRLEKAGYDHYEISNWARSNSEGEILSCRHNLQYWRNGPYLGFGAGAHGWVGGYRTLNTSAPKAYIKRLLSDQQFSFPLTAATASSEQTGRQRAMAETMMMGLRLLKEGVSQQDFAERFGQSLDVVYPKQLDRLESNSLLERKGPKKDRLLLTRNAILLGNQVFSEFV